jgi:hypothetical protein
MRAWQIEPENDGTAFFFFFLLFSGCVPGVL